MNKMINMPEIKLGIAAVSRSCFPKSLSEGRCKEVCRKCAERGIEIFCCPTVSENEKDMQKENVLKKNGGAR